MRAPTTALAALVMLSGLSGCERVEPAFAQCRAVAEQAYPKPDFSEIDVHAYHRGDLLKECMNGRDFKLEEPCALDNGLPTTDKMDSGCYRWKYLP